ncbi:hypothetical protein CFIO01_07248 [Colletotrichum fioriniae PJ7]|uniref:Uncharacterized protein n=1 Tax=Colletotrichum fioriniae PJ7 TaxID=1445577 RepID=A0A010QM64_9PEZI|nr:hypothetical protein CFIO01_07248 [Colletotrichum fioriniae PJ7]
MPGDIDHIFTFPLPFGRGIEIAVLTENLGEISTFGNSLHLTLLTDPPSSPGLGGIRSRPEAVMSPERHPLQECYSGETAAILVGDMDDDEDAVFYFELGKENGPQVSAASGKKQKLGHLKPQQLVEEPRIQAILQAIRTFSTNLQARRLCLFQSCSDHSIDWLWHSHYRKCSNTTDHLPTSGSQAIARRYLQRQHNVFQVYKIKTASSLMASWVVWCADRKNTNVEEVPGEIVKDDITGAADFGGATGTSELNPLSLQPQRNDTVLGIASLLTHSRTVVVS